MLFPSRMLKCWSVAASSPAVGRGDDQRVAHAGPAEAAAQLVEEAVGQRLQGQHQQQGAEEEAVGRLQTRRQTETPHMIRGGAQTTNFLSLSLTTELQRRFQRSARLLNFLEVTQSLDVLLLEESPTPDDYKAEFKGGQTHFSHIKVFVRVTLTPAFPWRLLKGTNAVFKFK